jgi:predicted MFS family arabinose efflux permease
MVEAVPPTHTGVSAGIQISSQALAASVMSAVIGTILVSNVIGAVQGTPVYADSAFTAIYYIGAAAGAAALVITLFMRHGRRAATGGLVSDPASAISLGDDRALSTQPGGVA